MRSNLKIVIAAMLVALIATAAMAAPKAKKPVAPKPIKGKAGQTGVILNQSDFCIFLPPMRGGGIAENEDKAVAFCTKPNLPGANAQTLPAGFIQTAHFVSNTAKGYVQVTGRMDGSKYGLKKNDGGGQYGE